MVPLDFLWQRTVNKMNKSVKTKKVILYNGFNRIWHWLQAILMVTLVFTGFEIHGKFSVIGFEDAVKVHDFALWSMLVLLIFALFWHLTTGAWRQYIPTTDFLGEMVDYYVRGIFKNEPHPTKKTELSKLNPLQRLTYLGLNLFMLPFQGITGFLYLYYAKMSSEGNTIFSLEQLGILHTIGAIFLVTFLIVHIYLTTTGHTVFSNIQAMITGWEEIEVDDDE
jgi:thiosulfate reductase cytochrome b subunit